MIISMNNDICKTMRKKCGSFFSPHIRNNVSISDKKANHLFGYYNLGPFDCRLYLISLDKHIRRNTDSLIRKNETFVAEIISLGIFSLPSFVEEPYPM